MGFHSLVVGKLCVVFLNFLVVISSFLRFSPLNELIQIFHENFYTLKGFAKVVCSLMVLRVLILNIRDIIVAYSQRLLVLRLLEYA